MASYTCYFCNSPVAATANNCPACGQPQILQGKYRVVRLLGQGGFALVYEVLDLRLNRRYALKLITNASGTAQKQVEAEANILAQHARRLQCMPEIYDIWSDGATTTLVMEYVDGPTLQELVDQHGPWSAYNVAQFLRAVLPDLARIHALGIIYRDLKPDNIKQTSDGHYVLLDFGIAKHTTGATLTAAKAGSLHYSPPEQIRGQPTDGRSDLYSLGATAYHMLTGQPPIPCEYRAAFNMPLPPPAQVVANVPPQLNNAIMAMLELDLARRPRDADASLALLNVAGSTTTTRARGQLPTMLTSPYSPAISPSPTIRVPTSTWQRLNWLGLLGAGAGIAVVLFFLVKLVSGSSSPPTAMIVPNTGTTPTATIVTPPSGAASAQQTTVVVASTDTARVAGQTATIVSSYNQWNYTANDLRVARYSFRATTLNDGRVLIEGGDSSESATRESELYDPVSNNWTPTGSLNEVRTGHTATLLSNGKVLVVGGYPQTSSSELYDPSTSRWTTTGGLIGPPRNRHTATLLKNGKVLVVGGWNGCMTADTEVFNPTSGTWITTGPLHTARADHAAVQLRDGRVLVVGGDEDCPNTKLRSAELYDPATGTWDYTGSMNVARAHLSAVLLTDGRVLVVGGDNTDGVVATAEIYNPVSGIWSLTSRMHRTRFFPLGDGAVSRPDGKVLVVGNDAADVVTGVRDGVSTSEIYDPANSTWSTPTAMNLGHCAAPPALLLDGRTLIVSGQNCASPNERLLKTEIYGSIDQSRPPLKRQ